MRVGEACGLTWDNIDLLSGTITVEKQMIKKEQEWIYGTPKTKSSNRTIRSHQNLYYNGYLFSCYK